MTKTGNVKGKVSRVTQNRKNVPNELIFKNSINYFRYPEIIKIIKEKVPIRSTWTTRMPIASCLTRLKNYFNSFLSR